MPVSSLLLWLILGAWATVEIYNSLTRRSSDRRQDRSTLRFALLASAVAIVAVVAIEYVGSTADESGAWRVVGAALVAAGLAFRLWSIRTLGALFSYHVTTNPNQELVTSGPYRWLCHPGYTGLLVCCVGAGVGSGDPVVLAVVTAIALIGLKRRIRVEESALSAAMGEHYDRHVEGRHRLIPFLW